jgi:PE-PPE domain/PE family
MCLESANTALPAPCSLLKEEPVSYVVATPDFLRTAAEDLAAMGSAVSAANAAAANSTMSLLAPGADEVSRRIAALFGAHALEYQAVSSQAAQFNERFVLGLAANANAYLTTEIANAEQGLWNAVNAPVQTLSGRPLIGNGANVTTPVSLPRAAAGTRITVPGAGPLYDPNFLTRLPYLGQVLLEGGIPGPSSVSILQGYDLLNHAIGENWFPGTTAQVVNYPASYGILSGSLAAPGANGAIAMGQRALNDQITNAVANGNGSPVHIAALSEGTVVVDRELAYLATDPTAPPANALQFVMFSNPELGLAHTYLPNGFTVPLINYTVQGLPNTQYNVSVVFGQYDFWGNPPDRPWNLLADVNSLFGAAYYHDPASLASPSDVVEVSSVTDSAGGTITTYMIPSPTLPMLLPLEQIGVPQPIVNNLNSVLQPIVNDGYSSLTPDAGPYFSGGSLVGLPAAVDVLGTLERGLSWSAPNHFG